MRTDAAHYQGVSSFDTVGLLIRNNYI